MKKMTERKNIRDVALIIAGTFLMGLAINLVFDPMGLDVGGVTGLSVLIKYMSGDIYEGGIPVWFSNLVINIPLFVFAIKMKGFKYILKTGVATLMLTLWLKIIPISTVLDDMLLATLFGGCLSGLGMGLVLATSSTTGGTDLFSVLIHEKWKHVSVPKLLFITDGTIVALGLYVFGREDIKLGLSKIVYAIVVVFLVSKISDSILDGIKFAKMAYIISDKAEEIASEILSEIDRGVTGIRIKGMYSGEDKKMLFCVVGKKQIVALTDIVNRHDKKAFMVIADAREVMGEGFAEVKNTN